MVAEDEAKAQGCPPQPFLTKGVSLIVSYPRAIEESQFSGESLATIQNYFTRGYKRIPVFSQDFLVFHQAANQDLLSLQKRYKKALAKLNKGNLIIRGLGPSFFIAVASSPDPLPL